LAIGKRQSVNQEGKLCLVLADVATCGIFRIITTLELFQHLTHLKVSDIDSQRMVIHVQGGKIVPTFGAALNAVDR
jgi:hypothetical protein